MKHSRLRTFTAISMVFVWLGSSSCAAVHPWERSRLAHPCMQSPVDAADAAYSSKVKASREASAGGISSAAGGCGCN